MAASLGPNTIENGLRLSLDAADKNSYKGSGTTWFDVSGYGYNGTLTNGPTFSNANGGSIVFDGVNDYVNCGNLGSFPTQGTLSYWMLSTAVENYRNPISTNYLAFNACIRFEQYTTSSPYGGFSAVIGNDAGAYNGFSYSPSTVLTANVWYNIVLTWNTITNQVSGYMNSVNMFSNSSNTYWPSTIPAMTLGSGFDSGRYFKGNISSFQFYNKRLTDAEVLQNYNAVRSRFGL